MEYKKLDAAETVADPKSLSEIFEQSMDLLHFIQTTERSTNSSEYQISVKTAIGQLEKATNMVNQLCMFSSNETIDEVATSDLKYLLLPALLGYFSTNLIDPDPKDRMQRLSLSELYYKDFLKRCKSYELPNVDIPEINDEEELLNSQQTKCAQSDLATMNSARDEKIRRYKAMKDIEKEIVRLKAILKMDDSHEMKRDYYLVLLKSWVLRAYEELSSMGMEKTLLQNVPKRKPNIQEQKKDRNPLQPVIIVRNELQKRVFGVGYPSIPAMTVDEFYQQRYPDGSQGNTTDTSMGSSQRMAAGPNGTKEEMELENAQEEELAEKDDHLLLKNARAFDDWKDDNRRGCGNMKNKG